MLVESSFLAVPQLALDMKPNAPALKQKALRLPLSEGSDQSGVIGNE